MIKRIIVLSAALIAGLGSGIAAAHGPAWSLTIGPGGLAGFSVGTPAPVWAPPAPVAVFPVHPRAAPVYPPQWVQAPWRPVHAPAPLYAPNPYYGQATPAYGVATAPVWVDPYYRHRHHHHRHHGYRQDWVPAY